MLVVVDNFFMIDDSPNKRGYVELRAYAKINLFLDVLGKMDGGFHSIRTLFSEIELYDNLKFSLTRYHDIKLLSDIKNLAIKDNLIFKIAVFIQAKYSVRYGAKINLKKNIPIAAGLGGGSSDAAATIRGLNRLWELKMTKEDMYVIAQRFGSDISFFITGYQAIGTGRGEIIQPLQSYIEMNDILLVNPNFPISSHEAYDTVNITSPNLNLPKLLETKNYEYCYNKLEEGILKTYPILNEIYDMLIQNEAKKVMLSGSGPTIIGFFDNRNSCCKALRLFRKKGFWSYKTSIRRRQIK